MESVGRGGIKELRTKRESIVPMTHTYTHTNRFTLGKCRRDSRRRLTKGDSILMDSSFSSSVIYTTDKVFSELGLSIQERKK